MLPVEQALLSELKRRSSWNRFAHLKSAEGLLHTPEARIVLRALAVLHKHSVNGTGEVKKNDLVRVALSMSGEKQAEVRRAIEFLGDPLPEEASWKTIWNLVSTQYLTQTQSRLLQAAREGGLDPTEARRVVDGWAELHNAAHSNHARRVPLSIREAQKAFPQDGERLPTGLHGDLDQELKGGIRRGELGCLVAASGHGKTANLIRTATSLAQRGLRVVYLSFEIYVPQIVERVATLTKRKLPATLFIQDYPADELTVEDVRQTVKDVGKFDCLIVDHVELLDLEGLDEIHAVGRAVRQLRNLAREENAVVWTASQGDEPDLGATFLERKDLYGSRKKLHSADIAIGLLYNPRRNLLTFNLWKTRHTKMGLKFGSTADFVKMSFQDTAMFQQ